MLERRPKRFLLGPEPTQIEPNITDIASDPDYIGCGSLLTQRDTDGARQELLLTSRSSFVIGRDPAICDYVVSSPFVSKRHLRLFATRNERNEAITCVEDTSANGILLNGRRPKTRSIILSEGDVIELPQARKSFEYREQPRADEPLATRKPGLNASNSKFLVVGRYKIHLKKSLGSGSFGVVRLAWDTMREIQVACKTIKKSRLDERTGDRVRLINEIQLGLILRHPNLNPILAFHETETEYHIFLSLVTGGDLFSYVTKHQGLDEAEAKFLAYQLMQGVKYLHDRGCAHRDLKPENILLKSGGSFPTLLICDFGLSTRADITKGQPQRAGKTAAVRAGSLVGTIDYMYIRASRFVASHRDEIQRGVKIKLSPLDATKSDCWALGVLIFIMATGCHPFGFQNSDIDDVANEFQIARSRDHHAQLDVPQDFGARIEQGSISFSLPVWKSYHPRVRDLLHHLLDPSPHLRLSIVGALAHAWFEMDRAVLEQCYELRVLARAALADDEGHEKMK